MTLHHLSLPCLILSVLLSQGCPDSNVEPLPDGAVVPDSGVGVCCPATDFRGCSPGESKPGGGWAPSLSECTYTINGFDGREFEEFTDEQGCQVVREGNVPCGVICDPVEGEFCYPGTCSSFEFECVDPEQTYSRCLDSSVAGWCPEARPEDGSPCCVRGPGGVCGDPSSIMWECLDNHWAQSAIAGSGER